MRYLLDTNICIALLKGDDRKLTARILSLPPRSIHLCSVVKAELLFGARNSRRVEDNLERLAKFFEPLQSLPFDDAAANQYGVLRAQQSRDGALIGGNDLLVAAIALAEDVALATRNHKEFGRIAGLRLLDW